MDKITIREATLEDTANILKFRKQIYSETDFLLNSSCEFNTTFQEQREFLKHTSQRDSGCFFIAIDNGNIIGSAGLHWVNKTRIRHCAEYGTAILKSHWKMGIASELLKRIVDIAPSCGIEKIQLETVKTNIPALNLYKKAGFIQEGIKTGAFKVNGKNYDVIVMGKVLL